MANLLKNDGTSASFGKDASTEQVLEGVSMGMDALVGGASAGIQIGQNIKQAGEIDERGNQAGEKDYMGNTMAGMKAGGDIGELFGPGGKLIGMAVGGGGAALATALGGGPDPDEMVAAKKQFQLGESMKSIGPEATFATQQLAAKNGMDIKGADKTIEVEKDELVLRKVGRTYRKVADFKGGKPHEMGGEQYDAKEGDVVVPGNKRNTVNRMIKHRRWGAIESLRMSLPTDTGQRTFAEGTDGVDNDPENWEVAKKHVKLAEGGVSTDKADKGNYTKINGEKKFIGTRFGLTFDTWRSHNKKKKPATEAEFNELKKEFNSVDADAVEQDFKTHYWDKYNLGDITDPTVAANIYDAAVNQGWTVSTSGKNNVNSSLGITGTANTEDTVEAINSVIAEKGADFVNDSIGKKRVERYKGSDTWKEHGKGWINNRVKPFLSEKGKEDATAGVDITPGNPIPAASEDPISKGIAQQNTAETRDETGATDFKELDIKQQQEALKKSDVNAKELESLPGFWHRGSPKGQQARIKKDASKMFIGGVMIPDYFNVGSRMLSLVGKDDGNTDEVGFEDSEQGKHMYEQAEKLHEAMEGDTSWWRRVFSELEGVDAIRNKILTGQSLDAGMPAATGNMMAGLEPEEVEELLGKLKDKGIIDEVGMQYGKFIYNNPDKVHTTEIKAGMAVDIASLAANPKAMLNALKIAGKGLIKGTKLTAKGVQALSKSANWKKAWTSIKKKSPALAKKFGNQMIDGMRTQDTYKGTESFDDMLNNVKQITKDLEDGGVAVSKENKTWAQKATVAFEKAKAWPATFKKNFQGNLEDVNKMNAHIQDVTGKTFEQLKHLPQDEINTLVKGKFDAKVKGMEDAITAYGDARKSHASIGADLKNAQKELKALQSGKADPIEIGKIEKQITAYGDKLVESEIAIEEAQKVSKMHFDEVVRLEGFMDDPIYRDKFRVAMQLQQGVIDQTKKLDQADGAVKEALRQETEVMRAMEGLSDSKKTVRQKAITDLSSANEARKANKVESLAEVRKAGGDAQAATGEMNKFKQQAGKFPRVFKALQNDAKLLEQVRSGTLGWMQAANILAEKERGVPDEKLNEEVKTLRDQEKENIKEPDKAPDGTTPGATAAQRPEVDGVIGGGDTKGTEITADIAPKTDIVEKKEVYKAGDAKPKIGPVVSGALSNLASYAPAFYNIAKGLEPADKVQRRFVSPQLKKYENVSQAQINAIDDAFNTAVGNARNLSGGMMSNFRSNTEKSWADKLKREAQVRTGETQRADAVASGNIDTLNQAEMYNSQVAGKADIMDMQSEAAKDSFLAQGFSDIANIGSRNKKDRQLQKNQDMMMGMMGSGTNFKVGQDGSIIFNNSGERSTPKSETPQATKGVAPTGNITPPTAKSAAEIGAIGQGAIAKKDKENEEILKTLNFGPMSGLGAFI